MAKVGFILFYFISFFFSSSFFSFVIRKVYCSSFFSAKYGVPKNDQIQIFWQSPRQFNATEGWLVYGARKIDMQWMHVPVYKDKLYLTLTCIPSSYQMYGSKQNMQAPSAAVGQIFRQRYEETEKRQTKQPFFPPLSFSKFISCLFAALLLIYLVCTPQVKKYITKAEVSYRRVILIQADLCCTHTSSCYTSMVILITCILEYK